MDAWQEHEAERRPYEAFACSRNIDSLRVEESRKSTNDGLIVMVKAQALKLGPSVAWWAELCGQH